MPRSRPSGPVKPRNAKSTNTTTKKTSLIDRLRPRWLLLFKTAVHGRLSRRSQDKCNVRAKRTGCKLLVLKGWRTGDVLRVDNFKPPRQADQPFTTRWLTLQSPGSEKKLLVCEDHPQ